MPLKKVIRWLTTMAGLVAASLALRAATIEVRDSLDQLIGDIALQSAWATWSAVATAFTALLLVWQTFLED